MLRKFNYLSFLYLSSSHFFSSLHLVCFVLLLSFHLVQDYTNDIVDIIVVVFHLVQYHLQVDDLV